MICGNTGLDVDACGAGCPWHGCASCGGRGTLLGSAGDRTNPKCDTCGGTGRKTVKVAETPSSVKRLCDVARRLSIPESSIAYHKLNDLALALLEGTHARYSGVRRGDNPYDMANEQYDWEAWDTGWDMADVVIQRDRKR